LKIIERSLSLICGQDKFCNYLAVLHLVTRRKVYGRSVFTGMDDIKIAALRNPVTLLQLAENPCAKKSDGA
jgi:hypothetical protein